MALTEQERATIAEKLQERATIAEKLMGWTRKETTYLLEGVQHCQTEWWVNQEGLCEIPIVAWKPDTDWRDTSKVFNRLVELGYSFKIAWGQSDPNGIGVEFLIPRGRYEDTICGIGSDFPEAIYRAALKVAEEMGEEKMR